MPLSAGEKLGPYEILAPIGKGGMGEVWKARDPRLNRDVAIKVSAAQFSERFEREAKAIAALNHPNICQIYDVGLNYLVMEYVEGTPLKGPLPVDQTLKYAVQICSALDAAHKKNIIHRDLKPANILATKTGIKLLDFGLAKLGSSGIEQAPKPDDATLTMALTGKNEIVGTLYYMSPEQLQAQANGQEIDGRSDIFSFGLVLYEMLTGKRAFEGSSPASVIAAIMERPAPSVAEIAPLALDRVLKRCLEKDPEDRWQSARDLKVALEIVGEAEALPEARRLPHAVGRTAWVVAGVLGLGFTVLAAIHFRERTPMAEPMRFQVTAPDKNSLNDPPSLSPDGRNVTFETTGADGLSHLWVRGLNSLDAKPLAEVTSNYYFWSPDSRFVAYVSGAKLRKVDIASGSSQAICDVPASFFGGAWNQEDVILFGAKGGLLRVAAGGGTPKAVTVSGPKTGRYHGLPWFLPDGRHFIYVGVPSPAIGTGRLFTGTLDAATEQQNYTPLLSVGSGAQYAPGSGRNHGYLLFVRESQLLAQIFDVSSMTLGGEPEVVADQIWSDGSVMSYFSVAGANLAYGVSPNAGEGQITWFDRQGVSLGTVGAPGAYSEIALSPDGKQLMAVRGSDIFITEMARNVTSRFTLGPGEKHSPVWVPDGSRILFASTRGDGEQISSKPVSGAGQEETVYKSEEPKTPNAWSPDGRFLVYTSAADQVGIWMLPLGAEGKPSGPPKPFLPIDFVSGQSQLSPDGRWLAYTAEDSGENEIYICSFPDGNTKALVSQGGGVEPRWRADGKELFYRRITGELVAVDVTTGPSLEVGASKVLFMGRFAGALNESHNPFWAPTADGKRFLGVVRARQSGDDVPVTVLVNWQSELKK